MSNEDFERIQPTQVDISPAPKTAPIATADSTPPVAVLVIGILLLLAAGVIFLLPDYVTRRHAPTPATASTQAGESRTPSPAPPSAETDAGSTIQEPYAAAVDAGERNATKKALDALLLVRHEVEEHGGERWAGAELEQAGSLASSGDVAYREGDYATARSKYQEAATLLRTTLDNVDARLQDRLGRGAAALSAGDAATAGTLFEEALAIDPDNAAARHGLQRAGTLDQVIALSTRAAAAADAADLELARQTYMEAIALDAAYEPARQALADVQSQIGEQAYRQQLSAGFAALAAGNDAKAAEAFRAALKLQKNSSEARDGLQQAEFQLSQQRISTLLVNARQAAAGERWSEAKRDYEAALAIDPTLAPALQGSQDAARRVALDEALNELERDPDRLLDRQTRKSAGELIASAQKMAESAPRLRAQLAKTRELLTAYSTPLPLRLRSDGQTEVSVLRVGRYGTLTERTLELLPGDYVAVGQRNGYRDVRVDFRIRAGQTPADVLVQCVEKV